MERSLVCNGRVGKTMVAEANQLTGSSDMRVPQVRVLLKASLGAWVLARPPRCFSSVCPVAGALGEVSSEVPSEYFLYEEGKGMQVQVMGASIAREHDGSLKKAQTATAHLPAWQSPLTERSCSGHAWRELRSFADSSGSLPVTAKGMFVSSFSV